MAALRSNEEFFSSIMQKSKLDMPYGDFEDRVMRRIEEDLKTKAVISGNIKLSIVFFLAGTIFGLLVDSLLSHSLSVLFNIPKEQALLFFHIGYVLFFLIQLDNILKLLKKNSNS